MTIPVHTYDIWDTCFVRATGSPFSIFVEAARSVLPGGSAEEVMTLAKQRDVAEDEARKLFPHRECNLAEIEAELARTVGKEIAAGYIAAELVLERASVRPVAATLARIARSREAGAVIAFASDMYLPEEFLRGLLVEHGFAKEGDRVFVSGDRRANKKSGQLFELMRAEVPVGRTAWVHHGDNPRADIAAARKQGIRPIEIRIADWTLAERLVLDSALPFSERIAAAMRTARVATDPEIPEGRAAFLAGVAAPWLVAFTTRTLALARKEGRRRIYFVARDGDIPLRVARVLAPEEIECRYLPGSRKAWCFPAMFDLSEACTSWLRLAPMRPDTLLASLGFNPAERDAIIARCGLSGGERERRRSQPELAPLWDDIEANDLAATITQRAGEARSDCIAFLRSEGLFDPVPWAIADVGWLLHGQAALKRILASAGASQEPHGIYFMVRSDRRPTSETGPAHSWLAGTEGSAVDPTVGLLSWMSPVIEECLLTSSDPSVAGYRTEQGAAAPIHADSNPSVETVRHASELRAYADAFAREVAGDVRNAEFVASLEACALQGLIRFLREPAEDEMEALRGLRHATAPGAPVADTQPLVRPYSIGDAIHLVLRRAGLRRADPGREPYWHSGSMAVSPSIARAGMKAALAPNPLKRLLQKAN